MYEGLQGGIRDPNALNDHVMIKFDGVIGEPQTAESLHCIWRAYEKAFSGSMNCCYKGLTAVFGVPVALMWGIKFACVSFNTIWCATPCIKMMRIYLSSWKDIYSSCVKCVCAPCFEAVGGMFSNIKVTQQ